MTRAWKERVRLALHANLAAGKSPKTASELAATVGAHKTGLLKMLDSDQPTYRYVREICNVLDIEEAMVDNPAVVTEDELERCITRLRHLSPKAQLRVLPVLEALIKQLDED